MDVAHVQRGRGRSIGVADGRGSSHRSLRVVVDIAAQSHRVGREHCVGKARLPCVGLRGVDHLHRSTIRSRVRVAQGEAQRVGGPVIGQSAEGSARRHVVAVRERSSKGFHVTGRSRRAVAHHKIGRRKAATGMDVAQVEVGRSHGVACVRIDTTSDRDVGGFEGCITQPACSCSIRCQSKGHRAVLGSGTCRRKSSNTDGAAVATTCKQADRSARSSSVAARKRHIEAFRVGTTCRRVGDDHILVTKGHSNVRVAQGYIRVQPSSRVVVDATGDGDVCGTVAAGSAGEG